MATFTVSLALGIALGATCGLLLASIVIWLIESAGRAVDDLEDDHR